jgi:hypothetical protein
VRHGVTIISGMPVVAGQERRRATSGRGASTAASDQHEEGVATPWRARLAADGPFLVLLGATLVLCLFLLRPGHDWGDDFALYINQARALVRGDVNALYEQNRYTVEQSAWHTFSPYTYGWGFPLLLAPLYAVFGISFTAFKNLEVLFYLAFVTAFYALIRDRIDRLAALLIISAIVLDTLYASWTNTVLTEFPFLCCAVLSLLAIDALHRPARLPSWPPTLRALLPLAGLGVLLGFTANIRTEGALLLAALAARQVVVAVDHRRAWRGRWLGQLGILGVPWLTAIIVGVGLRLVLPTDDGRALTLSGGLGGHNFKTNDGFYRATLAELLAVKDKVHGTLLLGLLVFLIVLAIGGMILGGRRDVSMSVFALALSVTYMELPYREGRYLLGVLPFLLYFAAQGLRGADIGRWGVQPRHVLLLALVARHGLVIANAADYWRTYPKAVEGPASVTSREMFAAVDTHVPPGQIVVFFRPRALNLFTHRTAITAGSSLQVLLERGDWYAMAKDSDYAQCALTDDEAAATGRITKVWENEAWVLWHVDREPGPLPPALATDVSTCRL